MATMAPAISSKFTFIHLFPNLNFNAASGSHCPMFCILQRRSCQSFRMAYINQTRERNHRNILRPVCAAGSGLETSMAESKGSTLKFKNVEIAVESQETDKLQLRVDLSGEDTQKAFDVVLANLAQSAPLLPGFRRQKGGKTSKVPKNLLMSILGKEVVMKFVLQEIVSSAVATYVKEENLTVKDNKINTTQTEEELNQSFSPGNGFGFNVELQLINEETDVSEETEESEETETANA